MSVLITAATRWEARPLAKGLGLSVFGENRFEGIVSGRRVVLIKTGVGAAQTAAVLNRGFLAGDYALAISAGLCGALQEGLRAGDIVADAQEVERDYVVPLRETAQTLGLRLHSGKILHTNVVLAPDMKRKLGAEHRMLACDMETAAVRRWAGSTIPAFGMRAVLDELDDALPQDSPDGEGPLEMARYALTHPRQLPHLMRTGLRCARAMKALTRFLKAYLEIL